MATGIASMITSIKLTNTQIAVYLNEFLKEIKGPDYQLLEKLANKKTLPNHQYGDTTTTGDTGGDAARTANIYSSRLDGFKVTVWDDIGFQMNYGFRLDDLDNSDNYGSELDYNFQDFEIAEGKGYGNTGTGAQNYRLHDKALTNKFHINIPIIRYGATNQWDSLCENLIPTEESRMLIKQFGKQAKMVQGQYIRATLINEATQHPQIDFSTSADGGVTEAAALETAINAAKRDMNLREAEKYAGLIKGTDVVGSSPVKPGYILIINTLVEDTVKLMPSFVDAVNYSSQMGLLDNEYGSILKGEVRIVVNNMLARGAGGTVSGANALGVADSMNASGMDIGEYNALLVAKDAYTIAALSGTQRYKMYIDEPGKGNDTLRLEKNAGWKSILGCKVTRPAWLHNFPLLINSLT